MIRFALYGVLLVCLAAGWSQAATPPGLAVTFTSAANEKRTDSIVLPNLAFYVVAKDAPTPFIGTGPFTARVEGFLSVDLRSDYSFAAELHGQLHLEINDRVVFDNRTNATGLTAERRLVSESVRLSKGANRLKATFISPASGDAFFRVGWTEKGTNTTPIPAAALTHSDSPGLQRSAQLAFGREVFLEYRCAKCHAEDNAALAEQADAPTFEEIGSHRHSDWMARWTLDPKALRANARMPRMLHTPDAAADARAIGAYLATLKTDGTEKRIAAATPPENAETKPLFERLHCNACHEFTAEVAPPKHSLRGVPQKFTSEALIAFLLDPAARYKSIRMPNFRLTPAEAAELAAHIFKNALSELNPSSGQTAVVDGSQDIQKGKQLVQTAGCLNCHSLKAENKYSAPKLAGLNWDRGCLGEHGTGSRAPQFDLSAEERAAVRAFGRAGLPGLTHHAPMEFALRQTRALNCNACHGQLEGFPALDILGGKLKGSWMGGFISGNISYKPRAERHPAGEPWLEARMPGFKAHGVKVGEGLAALHGYPPKTRAEDTVDSAMAEHGRKLIGKDGGFSCISCHGVRSLAAMEVFDAEGINFQWSADRLLPDYYRRWMRNPLAIDPQTKMPVYFEDGQSPLTEILEGDAEKQIDAIWHYLRLRDKMPLPAVEPSQ